MEVSCFWHPNSCPFIGSFKIYHLLITSASSLDWLQSPLSKPTRRPLRTIFTASNSYALLSQAFVCDLLFARHSLPGISSSFTFQLPHPFHTLHEKISWCFMFLLWGLPFLAPSPLHGKCLAWTPPSLWRMDVLVTFVLSTPLFM